MVARETVTDQVFASLREEILTGHQQPGATLPPLRRLATRFGVSVAVVREAVGRLEQLRLVEVRQGSGMVVQDWRRAGGLETLALGGLPVSEIAGDLFEARTLLLVESARLAGSRASAAARVDVAMAMGDVARAEGIKTSLVADWEFMAAVVEASGNLVFQLILNSVRELYLPHAEAFAAIVGGRDELIPMYEGVASAIHAGDGDAAAGAMRELALAQGRRIAAR
ncbi:MAG TPA: GntR family transcriptional regulator [Solirubrobacteraceae bacterium]|nr:GntR family transcriptional regulator [Solirubrobacteraceae bacterium]